MKASTGQKHRVARLHREAVQRVGHCSVGDAFFEVRTRDAALQTDVERGVRCRIRDEPHLRLGLAAHAGGDRSGRVNLEGERFLGIEDFYEDGKRPGGRSAGPEHCLAMILHQPAESLASQRPVGDDADPFRSVRHFPGFADRIAGRQRFLVEPLKVATTPDTFLEDGLECERVEHRKS